MSRPIVVYGAGGHGREIAALIRDLRRAGESWELQGFLSDDPTSWGNEVAGAPVLGDGQWAAHRHGLAVALGVGDPAARYRVVANLAEYDLDFPPLVHPTATIMERSSIGRGGIAAAGVVVTVDVEVGEFAVLNVQASLSHDCRAGPYATLGPRAALPGGVIVGTGCDIGAGTSSVPRVVVGDWAIVGAGAVITRDLPADCTAVGVPARVSSRRKAGWHLVAPAR